jgi:hypothetical protein
MVQFNGTGFFFFRPNGSLELATARLNGDAPIRSILEPSTLAKYPHPPTWQGWAMSTKIRMNLGVHADQSKYNLYLCPQTLMKVRGLALRTGPLSPLT